jgi:hypothetical protein
MDPTGGSEGIRKWVVSAVLVSRPEAPGRAHEAELSATRRLASTGTRIMRWHGLERTLPSGLGRRGRMLRGWVAGVLGRPTAAVPLPSSRRSHDATELDLLTCAGPHLMVCFEVDGAVGGLADVVTWRGVPVSRGGRSAWDGSGGFRCTGRVSHLRSEVAKPSPDPGRGQSRGRGRAFPGAA